MPRMMKAAVFTEESGQNCELLDVVLADPDKGEIQIKVKACGICHTDIGISEYQSRPCVLGHEAAGEVVALGPDVTAFAVGDRVVATFGSCGTCETCNAGDPAYCIDHIQVNFDGLRLNGQPSISFPNETPVFSAFFQQSSFAEYAICQVQNVVKIPDGLSFENAAPLGCGIQTGAGAVINTLNARKGESIVIFGVGAVGLSAVMAAHDIGCNPIIVADLNADRLQLAKSYGAHHVFKGDEANLVDRIKDITGGGAHYSIEGTGSLAVYHTAINCLRPKGVCGTLAYNGEFGQPVPHPGGFAFMNTRTVGIIEGDSVPTRFIPDLINMNLNGTLPYTDLIQTLPFERINDALDALRNQTAIKPVIVFD